MLPRGTGPLGFYEDPAQNVPIRSVKLASDVPPAQRSPLQLLRTDSATSPNWSSRAATAATRGTSAPPAT